MEKGYSTLNALILRPEGKANDTLCLRFSFELKQSVGMMGRVAKGAMGQNRL